MRPLILIAMTALTLGACRGRGDADANRSADAGLTAENIVSNDVTAIDAVTADAANMAADVDYTDAFANLAGNRATAGDADDKTECGGPSKCDVLHETPPND